MNNLLSWAFWFNSRPEAIDLQGQKILVSIAVILLLLVIIIITRSYGGKLLIYKTTINNLNPFCLTNAIISLYFLFLNHQLIPILRARVWYIIWLIIAMFWLILIIKKAININLKKQELTRQAEIKKYLP
jgi:hypothetical protein